MTAFVALYARPVIVRGQHCTSLLPGADPRDDDANVRIPCATDVERLRPGLGSLLESLIGRLAVQAAVGPVIVVEVLPLAQLVVEELGVVDHHPVQQAVELLDIDAMGALDLAVESRGAGLDVDMADALSSTCQWKLAPNSTPLSVWMTSTRNGSRSST